MSVSTKYNPLSSPRSSESNEEDKDHERFQSEQVQHLAHRLQAGIWTWSTVVTLTNLLMLILSLTLLVKSRSSGINSALKAASTWSLVYDLIDLNAQTKTLNGSLFPSSLTPSITRQFPNPIADAVWDEWEIQRIFPVPASTIRRLGKDPSTAIKLSATKFNFTEDMYATQLDVYHQLHCLNTLRQVAYGHYYNQSQLRSSIDESTIDEVHMNHCVDILAQMIQCSGNMNLVTVHWAKNFRNPMTDFSIDRKCVDFERLTEWRKENTLDMDAYDEVIIKKPKGQVQQPDPLPMWWPTQIWSS